MKNSQNKSRWVAQTGMLLALLIALQWGTAWTSPFAGQYITGSCVNCVLVIATLVAGLWSGVAIGALSPICAFLFGIGPKLMQIVPAIILGNLMLVLLTHVTLGRNPQKLWEKAVSILMLSSCKFVTLYCAVVQVLIPMMGPMLSEKQAVTFTAMFSWPQLVTALIGSSLAVLLLPVLRKARKKSAD